MREVGGTNGQLDSNPCDIARWVERWPCTWGFQWCPWDPELHSFAFFHEWNPASWASSQDAFVQEDGRQTGRVGWSSTFPWRRADCQQVPALCRPFERNCIYRVRWRVRGNPRSRDLHVRFEKFPCQKMHMRCNWSELAAEGSQTQGGVEKI